MGNNGQQESSSSATNTPTGSNGGYYETLGGFPNIGGRFISPPDKYNGIGQKQAERWLIKMKDIIRIYKIKDFRTVISIAGSHLEDDALDWWFNVESEVESWQEFEEGFKRKYMKNVMENAWKELKSLEQNENENIDEFSARLKSVVKRVGVISDEQMKSVFIASIHPQIAIEMEKLLSSNKSLKYDELLDKAMEHEYLLKKYKVNDVRRRDHDKLSQLEDSVKKNVTFSNGTDNSSAVTNRNVKSVDETTSINTNASLNSILSQLVEEMKALKIHFVEQSEIIQQQQKMINQHYQQQAPYSYQNAPRGGYYNNNYNGNNGGGRPPLFCYGCRQEGHIRRNCPEEVGRNNGNTQNGSGITAVYNNNNTSPNTNTNAVNTNNFVSTSGKEMGHP